MHLLLTHISVKFQSIQMATATKPKASDVKKKKASTKKRSVKKVPTEIILKTDKVTPKKSVTETVKKAVKKKVEIEVKKEDLEAFTFEQMLEQSFGKKGTEERDKAEILINEGVVKLVADVQAKIKQEKEPEHVIEEKKVIEAIEEKSTLPKGILPADYVPETKKEVIENKEANNAPKRPIQLNREFLIHQGSEFLNGELKVQENDTKIARIEDTKYVIYKNIGNPSAFTANFNCVDLDEAELLLDELIAYEKKQKEMEKEPKSETPIQEPNKPEAISEEQKKEIINKFEGLPLTEVNIKELIKAAGDSPNSNNPIANQVAQNNVSNAQTASAMESYGDTIAALINQKPWQKMSTTDVNRMLSTQCSRLYNYLLKNDGQGYYVELTQGHIKCRCPRDPNAFLNVA